MVTSSHGVITVRTIVDLPELERDRLDALCRQRGIARAEALRLRLEPPPPQHRQVFGLRRDRSDDALSIQDSLRQEWAGR